MDAAQHCAMDRFTCLADPPFLLFSLLSRVLKAPAYTAFSSGTALGSSSPSSASGAFVPSSLPPAPILDDSAPSTTIQVRTSDGKKLRLKVNTSITVAQLAALVVENTGSDMTFALSAGFPPKELSDAQATIETAGLIGAAVTQK